MLCDLYANRMNMDVFAEEIFCINPDEINNLIKHLYKYAFVDLMTGLKNRNAYEEKLNSLRANCCRLKGIQVVVIDINGLKTINDNYGHDFGDEAIKTIGTCIQETLGNKGFCARIGGDEFVCMLHGDISENIEDFNRMVRLKSYFAEYPLSVSIGIAEYNEKTDNGIDSLIKRCDNLMYMKKRAMKAVECNFHQNQAETVA